MRLDEYRSHDAIGLAELVSSKQVSALELLELCVSSIERQNPTMNAIVHTMYDLARRQIASGLPDGPFRGVPFLLKDLVADYAGVPQSNGSAFYGDWAPSEHSALVERCLNAGLVVFAKANTSEFGLLPVTEPPRFGPTGNPWDVRHTAGGSSGGSAASVAAGMVPMASGGDGGGSIRIPASCCGIFGLKPTRGRNPTAPYVQAWEGFAQEHVLTRSVRDSAAMLDLLNLPEVGSAYFTPPPAQSFSAAIEQPQRPLRIAYSSRPVLGRTTHADCEAAIEDAVMLLRSIGHELIEATPSLDRREFIQCWAFAMAGQVAADVRLAAERVARRPTSERFQRMTWLSRILGEALPAAAYVEAVGKLRQIGRRFALFLNGYDAWLTPTLGQPPLRHGGLDTPGVRGVLEQLVAQLGSGKLLLWSKQVAETAQPSFDFVSYTPLANVGGQPSMSVPLFWNGAGLPIGVMLTAGFGEDATLLRLARQLEQARPWFDKRPPEPA
jgi:amidase